MGIVLICLAMLLACLTIMRVEKKHWLAACVVVLASAFIASALLAKFIR